MYEIRHTLKALGVYYGLLLVTMLPTASIIPNAFPFNSFSSVVLLTLSVVLFLYYQHRIVSRGYVKSLMLGIALMLSLLVLLRGIKYSAFTETAFLARHTWYFYYLPMLLIPQLFFFTALCIHARDTGAVLKKWLWTFLLSVTFILLVLTNDLHQLVFVFHPGFLDWDSHYDHTALFYALTVWQYALYIAAAMVLLMKCRRSTAKNHFWLLLIPLLLGVGMMVLLLTGNMPQYHGSNLIEYPETVGFMVAGLLECCMQLGLIPTNKYYRDLMHISSVAAVITDKEGTPVFQSAVAADFDVQSLRAAPVVQLNENTLLQRKEIPGGYGFWQEDITELNRINNALTEAKQRLSEESKLMQLQNNLQEKHRKIEQRIAIYDKIAGQTLSQSEQIARLSEEGLSASPTEQDRIKKQIILLGAYIKRYANLMILASRNPMLNIAELGLSLAESLHYLDYYGISGSLYNTAVGELSTQRALTVFAFYETLLEESLPRLSGIYCTLTSGENAFVWKLSMEGTEADVSPEQEQLLQSCGCSLQKSYEDSITYLSLTIPKGGAAQ